jgi:HAD superfamily hydrolase (TIGR01509 family)
MKKIEAVIFDIDGTLYPLDDKDESDIRTSKLGKTIESNCIRYFQNQFKLEAEAAKAIFIDLRERYKGQVSLAVEKEFGLSRSEYFAFTWDFPVQDFVDKNVELVKSLQQLSIQAGILTAAPKVWAERVLEFLQIRTIFGEVVFTGDPDIRKPNPQAFQQVADFLKLDPTQILAVGDQEETDILPAKSLGMKTLRIAGQGQSNSKTVSTQADFIAPDIVTALKLLKKKGII